MAVKARAEKAELKLAQTDKYRVELENQQQDFRTSLKAITDKLLAMQGNLYLYYCIVSHV